MALCKMCSISSVDRSFVSIRWRIGFLVFGGAFGKNGYNHSVFFTRKI